MTRLLIVLLIALVFESIGVVFLSKGLKLLEPPAHYTLTEILRLVGRGLLNKYILAGVFFEALFFAGLLYMMSQADISFVWPLTSLSFVFSSLMARYYLHEHISSLRWAGVVLIMCGAALITWSEKVHERKTAELATQSPAETPDEPHGP